MFLLLYFNTVNTFASPQSKTLSQGIYNVRNTNLLVGTPFTVKVTSATSKAIILVIDSDQIIHSLIRLTPKIQQQTLPPLDYDYSLIIFSNGSVSFS
jgi:hypothetical protein